MISNRILQSSSTLSRFVPLFIRCGSTLSKQASPSQNKSTKKDNTGKYASEYLAADMYNYTPFSYYEMEESIIKYRLPQPSSYAPLKPEPAPPKK